MSKVKPLIPSKVLTPHQIAEHEKAIQKEKTERAQAAKSALEKWSADFNCELSGVPVYVQNPQGGFITAIEIKIIPK